MDDLATLWPLVPPEVERQMGELVRIQPLAVRLEGLAAQQSVGLDAYHGWRILGSSRGWGGRPPGRLTRGAGRSNS